MGKKEAASQNGPFGMADGASEEKGFIDFRDHGSWGDLEFDTSLRARFFVGRRGSGKSRYLREQERAASKRMLLFKQTAETIWLNELKRFHREYGDDPEREEAWIRLWHAAIHLALGSFLINHSDVAKALSDEDQNILVDLVVANLGTASAPFGVIATLNQLLKKTDGARTKVEALLGKTDWSVLEYVVSKLISVTQPVGMFIDTIDDNFRYAPTESAHAQIGLMLYMSRTLTDTSRSNRSHLFITVRDVVYSQFLDHEQSERYKNEVHWKILDWRKASARYFFEEKIMMLSSKYLQKPEVKDDPFERWLGVKTVHNSRRNCEENIVDFLLRHTRFLPREVVEIGNALSDAMMTEDSADIWSLVVKEAENIGKRALDVVCDHIISLSNEVFPTEKARQDYRNLVLAGFKAFRASLSTEIFSSEELMEANKSFIQVCGDFEKKISLPHLLWQHGLIGYIYSNEIVSVKDTTVFYHAVGGVAGNAAYALPEAKQYRLHASLVNGASITLDQNPPLVESEGIAE